MSSPVGQTDEVPPDWKRVVASLAGRRVLVIGDVMLDEYVSGDARRVCPEAPVPVVEAKERWVVPGGAANAAANIAALGGRVLLGGVIGDDAAAGELVRAIRDSGVDARGLVTDHSRPTTTKFRVLARGQQVIRVDRESIAPISQTVCDSLTAWGAACVQDVDAVLLSDYGKGLFAETLASRVIEAAREKHRPVIVDPKGTDWQRYRGATVIKPNLGELADLTGAKVGSHEELLQAGQILAERMTGTTVLVTRGAEGMAIFKAGISSRFMGAGITRRVFDVTGAGDTAAAALVLTMAAGWETCTGARVANAAGSVAVSKVGTSTVTAAEILTVLGDEGTDEVTD